jgi:uncharacterized membrane-anchored protein YhcB (DUF1043 family)
MTTNVCGFDSVDYQRYVSRVRALISDITKVNQDVINCQRSFNKDNFDSYREHLSNLMTAKNPLEYFKMNREYMQSSFQKVARLVEKRNQLFSELNQKLMQESDSLLCLFPQQIQDAVKKYRDSGVVYPISPTIWQDFAEKFKV